MIKAGILDSLVPDTATSDVFEYDHEEDKDFVRAMVDEINNDINKNSKNGVLKIFIDPALKKQFESKDFKTGVAKFASPDELSKIIGQEYFTNLSNSTVLKGDAFKVRFEEYFPKIINALSEAGTLPSASIAPSMLLKLRKKI